MRPAFEGLLIGSTIGLVITLVLVVVQKESKKASLKRNQELAEIIATACGCKRSINPQ